MPVLGHLKMLYRAYAQQLANMYALSRTSHFVEQTLQLLDGFLVLGANGCQRPSLLARRLASFRVAAKTFKVKKFSDEC